MNKILSLGNQVAEGLEKMSCLPALLARLVVGWVFIESGWGKIHNIPKVTEFFTTLGLPAPMFHAYFVSTTELVCGALIFFGFLSRLASIPLMITMVVAILTAKRADINEFSDLFGFSEFLYILLLFWIMIVGAGKLSLDNLFFKKRVN